MTQDERWLARYNEVKSFIEMNHRNPSKYYDEEKLMVHFLKDQGDRNFHTPSAHSILTYGRVPPCKA